MPATIFAGSKVKALKDRLSLNDTTEIISVNADPSSGAGVAAPLGSIAMDYLAGKVYKKTGALATEWQELGAGLGGINYIENPDAESGTTGWATYADAAGSQPVDGTGGTANITWSRSTTSPLRGVADFNLVKDAVNRQGQGVSYDFSIDPADQAKILTISFDYEVLSGTYATGDLAVYVIQDPAGTPVVLQPAGFQVEAVTVGNKVREVCTFQTASNVTSYRLCIHVASTSASAYSLAIDNVSVSPQQVVYGAPVTDWATDSRISFGLGVTSIGNGSVKYSSRRVGDSLEVEATFLVGSTSTFNASAIALNLTGISIDTSKTGNAAVANTAVDGGGWFFDSSTGNRYLLGPYVQNATQIVFNLGSLNSAPLSGTNPVALATNDIVSVKVTIPILGWSSSVVVSSSTDTRVVAASMFNSGSVAAVANTLIPFTNVIFDTHSALTLASGRLTAPVPGYYDVVFTGWSRTVGGGGTVYIWKNGASFAAIFSFIAANTGHCGSAKLFLNAGDYIDFRTDSNFTLNSGFVVSVSRISGPSQIAASETVAARYADTSGQAIGTSLGIFKFATRDYDSHGAMNTSSGVYTAPISGKYSIDVTIFTNAILLSVAQALVLAVYKNGTLFSYLGQSNGNGAGVNQFIQGYDTISLNAGDTLSVYISSSVAGTGNATAGANHIEINRIGN